MTIPRTAIDSILILALIVAGVGILQIARGTRAIQQALLDRQVRWSATVDNLGPYMDRQERAVVDAMKVQGEILERVRAMSGSSCHQGK
jgi:hypothetical protein